MSRKKLKGSTLQLKLKSIIDNNYKRFDKIGENSAKTVIRDVKSLIEIDRDIRAALNPANITELNNFKPKKEEEPKTVSSEDLIQLANDLDDYLIEMIKDKRNEDKKLVNDYDDKIINVYIIIIIY